MEEQKKLKGVSYDPKRLRLKYKSVIKVCGKTKHLGYFATPEEAHQAYLKAKQEKVS